MFKRRRLAVSVSLKLCLNGSVLAIKELICHLGSLLSGVRDDLVSVECRMNFYTAANILLVS